jgi:hypothetical protein
MLFSDADLEASRYGTERNAQQDWDLLLFNL